MLRQVGLQATGFSAEVPAAVQNTSADPDQGS